MKKARTILGFVAAFAGTVFLGNLAVHRFAPQYAGERDLEAASSAYAKDKLITKSDYLRLDRLGKSIGNTKKISDADFAWLMQIMEPTFHSSDYRMPLVRVRIAACFMDARELTSSQRKALFPLMVRLLKTASDADRAHLDQMIALRLATSMRDKQAVPYLLPLSHSRSAEVRDLASKSLAYYGIAANEASAMILSP